MANAGYTTRTFYTGDFGAATDWTDSGALSDTRQWTSRNPYPPYQDLSVVGPNSATASSNRSVGADGALTLTNTYVSNALFGHLGQGTQWKGAAFGGGAYYEAWLSWDTSLVAEDNTNPDCIYRYGTATSDICWPAWWVMPWESFTNQLTTTPGAGRFNVSAKHFVEMDIVEVGVFSGQGQFTATMWDRLQGPIFSGTGHKNVMSAVYPDVKKSSPPAAYGMLWVPANATTGAQGSATLLVNGTNYWTWKWQAIDCANFDLATLLAQSTANSPNAFAVLDCMHGVLILNTGASIPLTVHNVSVWQIDNSSNLYA